MVGERRGAVFDEEYIDDDYVSIICIQDQHLYEYDTPQSCHSSCRISNG